MAKIYQMKCPKCGHLFEVMKGILMNECNKPVPIERNDEVPFKCPKCGKKFCVTDDDFNINVETIIMAD